MRDGTYFILYIIAIIFTILNLLTFGEMLFITVIMALWINDAIVDSGVFNIEKKK